eukprot:tig00020685_g12971.t1
MRYLVAVDGSEGADKAFRMTLGAWMKPGDELLLATCSEVVDHPGLKAYYMHIEEELNKKTREHSAGILQKYSALAQQAGVAAKCVELVGSAREKLIAAADDAKVDVLVVGRRGLNESERLLMGSTSEHVLKSAGCTVIVVR